MYEKVGKDHWKMEGEGLDIHVVQTEETIQLAVSRPLVGAVKRALLRAIVLQFLTIFSEFFGSLKDVTWGCILRGGLFVKPSRDWFAKNGDGLTVGVDFEMKRREDSSKESGWRGEILDDLFRLIQTITGVLIAGETCLASGTTLCTLADYLILSGSKLNHLVVFSPVVGSYGVKKLYQLCHLNHIKLTVITAGVWWVDRDGLESKLRYTDFILKPAGQDHEFYFVTPGAEEAYRQFWGDDESKWGCVVGDAGDSMAFIEAGMCNSLEDEKSQRVYKIKSIKGAVDLGQDPQKLYPEWGVSELKVEINRQVA